jgi:hypothetical protein
MDIRIGVQNSAREVALESNDSSADVNAKVAAAIKDGSVLTLTDDKGRTVIVPGDKIAFVEIGVASVSKVGFAN